MESPATASCGPAPVPRKDGEISHGESIVRGFNAESRRTWRRLERRVKVLFHLWLAHLSRKETLIHLLHYQSRGPYYEPNPLLVPRFGVPVLYPFRENGIRTVLACCTTRLGQDNCVDAVAGSFAHSLGLNQRPHGTNVLRAMSFTALGYT